MKLKFLNFFVVLIAYSSSICAQEDLDAIFDDGDETNGFGIAVGSDLVTLGTGTLNVFGEFTLLDRVGIFAGIGTMPLGTIMDFTNPDIIGNPEDDNLFIRGLTKPFYYNIGLKYIETRGFIPIYVYSEFKNWRWIPADLAYENAIINRRKINFGVGHEFFLFDRIGCDIHTGTFLGLLAIKSLVSDDPNNLQYGPNSTYDIFIGFDLGLSLKYKL